MFSLPCYFSEFIMHILANEELMQIVPTRSLDFLDKGN
jgi:hypothetical protein